MRDPFSDDQSVSFSEALPDYVTIDGNEFELSEELPGGRPPSYIPLRPSQPLIYTFKHWKSNSMLLMPPRTARNLSPVYNIGVSLNLRPFTPLSYVTTVRRGGTADGPVVGEFEIAVSHSRAIVSFGAHPATRMSNVFDMYGTSRVWRWKHADVDLRWDCRTRLDDGSPMCICSTAQENQLASFVPPPLDASPPLPDATLTVFPDGHSLFDDILLSALILDRKMTLA